MSKARRASPRTTGPVEGAVQWQGALVRALEALGMAQDVDKAPLLIRYLEQLARWNHVYNLTSIREPGRMLTHHLVDSLAVVPTLRAARGSLPTTLVDVGSGAGLPGIVVAICQPTWRVLCVDAVAKKVAFLRHVSGLLGLGGVQALHARIETQASLEADLVISRAFSSLEDFAKASVRHLRPGGRLYAMKGHYPADEVDAMESATACRVQRTIALSVPGLNAARCLLELQCDGEASS